LKKIAFKSMHLPLESTPAEIQAVIEKTRSAGLEPYAAGVIYMNTEPEVIQAFEYARTAGLGLIVGVPAHGLLGAVEREVRRSGIRLAVHNHGPSDKLYPTPESAYEKVKGLDPGIGLCLDVGHTQRSGVDPAEAAERFFDRLLDVHVKDVTAASASGSTVEAGRGVVDLPKFIRALARKGYRGTVSLEYEKDEKDPLPGAAESVGYLRGILAAAAAGRP
jgi:sugar phosphate isomerase/epimerase